MNNKIPEFKKEKILNSIYIALIWSIIIFILIILPHAHSIDLTGFGKITGLMHIAEENKEIKSIEESEKNNKNTKLKTLERIITLPAKWDIEIKFKVNKWDVFNFSWKSSKVVYFDFHGTPTQKEWKRFLPFKSYLDGKKDFHKDSLIPEFTGTHGWYWRNLSNETITITLSLEGDFEK